MSNQPPTHSCHVCGKSEPWGPSWRWALDQRGMPSSSLFYREGIPVIPTCSSRCRRDAQVRA